MHVLRYLDDITGSPYAYHRLLPARKLAKVMLRQINHLAEVVGPDEDPEVRLADVNFAIKLLKLHKRHADSLRWLVNPAAVEVPHKFMRYDIIIATSSDYDWCCSHEGGCHSGSVFSTKCDSLNYEGSFAAC